jgi:hypothetical protein
VLDFDVVLEEELRVVDEEEDEAGRVDLVVEELPLVDEEEEEEDGRVDLVVEELRLVDEEDEEDGRVDLLVDELLRVAELDFDLFEELPRLELALLFRVALDERLGLTGRPVVDVLLLPVFFADSFRSLGRTSERR